MLKTSKPSKDKKSLRKHPLIVFDESKTYGQNLFKIIFIYSPALLISVIYYLSLIYIAVFNESFGITEEITPTILEITKASIQIGIYYWGIVNHFITIIFILLIFFYKKKLTKKGKALAKSKRKCVKAFLALLTIIVISTSPFLIVQTIEYAETEANKLKIEVQKNENLSIITKGDKVIVKGKIIAMNSSMFWIYNGKETVAMATGNHKITTPVSPPKDLTWWMDILIKLNKINRDIQ